MARTKHAMVFYEKPGTKILVSTSNKNQRTETFYLDEGLMHTKCQRHLSLHWSIEILQKQDHKPTLMSNKNRIIHNHLINHRYVDT